MNVFFELEKQVQDFAVALFSQVLLQSSNPRLMRRFYRERELAHACKLSQRLRRRRNGVREIDKTGCGPLGFHGLELR